MTTNPQSSESRLDRAEALILGLAERSDIIQQQVNLNSNAIAQTQQPCSQLTPRSTGSVRCCTPNSDAVHPPIARVGSDPSDAAKGTAAT